MRPKHCIQYIICATAIIGTLSEPGECENGLRKRYLAQALQGQLKPIAHEMSNPGSNLSDKENKLVADFAKRFGPDGQVKDPDIKKPLIHDIVRTYREYWTDVLFHDYTKEDRENMIEARVGEVLREHGIQTPNSLSPLEQIIIEFEKRGYRALTGMTLPHFDLLSWGGEEVVDFYAALTDCTVPVRVHFMSDFVSFGWSHYATFGISYPGGWANSEGLFCMSEDYDRASEKFKVSYLQHEGRHFADYKIFPNLQQADLEYRSKLTELVFADTTLYALLKRFAGNAVRNERSPHSLANHELISKLSQAVFGEPFVEIPERWKEIDASRIHTEAADLLKRSTEMLTEAGADTVRGLIRP